MNPTFLEQLLAKPLATVIEYYASCLDANPKAVAALRRLGLDPRPTLSEDSATNAADSATEITTIAEQPATLVGFSDRSLGKQLPSKIIKAGRTIRGRLEELGVYRSNGREHFRGYLTVPLYSTNGEVTGIYGRRMDRGAGPIELSIGNGIFNARALGLCTEIIVTDNVLDAWTLLAAGHENVICAVNYALQIADCQSVKRVLLTAPNIDCEPFAQCEIERITLADDQSLRDYFAPPAAEAQASSNKADGRLESDDARHVAASQAAALEEENMASDKAIAAGPVVPIGVDDLQVAHSDTETTITSEWRRWRIRGLERNTVAGIMKVNVLIYNERSDRFHVDCFDLHHARSRRVFTAEAADEIGVDEAQLRSDLGRVLLKLEQLQVEHKQTGKRHNPVMQLKHSERSAALDLLRADNLLERIVEDFDACGIVGERTAKLTGYLAGTSRLLDRPLGLVIQSSSAAGKSSLMEAILAFMPEEQQLVCSAMTGQSLYYADNLDLRHKILCIAEQAGIREASYALKLLQSDGKLSIASTAKESGTGRTAVELHRVEGPVALLLTTTASDVDAELMNRCLVLSVDEAPQQTDAIQARQRSGETLEAFVASQHATRIRRQHQNAQRLLRPLAVLNPYAPQLTFTSRRVRNRRDHAKYLTLIRAIAFLHQYQRDVRTTKTAKGEPLEYIEVTRQDISVANALADPIMGSSIDELPPQTRRLLLDLHRFVREQAAQQRVPESEVRFTRRQVREQLAWGATALRVHLDRLAHWEYVMARGGSRGKLTEYELLFDGRGHEGQPTLCGLVDPGKLTDPSAVPC